MRDGYCPEGEHEAGRRKSLRHMQDVVLRRVLLQVAESIGGLARVVFAVLTTAVRKEEEEEKALVPGERWQPRELGPPVRVTRATA